MVTRSNKTAHPLAESEATKMLGGAIAALKERSGVNLAHTAEAVGISVAALSHMAIGRAPIPIDRAPDLAQKLKMDRATFVSAVLRQRHPEAMEVIAVSGAKQLPQAERDLAWYIGRPPSELIPEQVRVIREVAHDIRPGERWLQIAELPAIKTIRRLRPNGPSADDISDIEIALIAAEEAVHQLVEDDRK